MYVPALHLHERSGLLSYSTSGAWPLRHAAVVSIQQPPAISKRKSLQWIIRSQLIVSKACLLPHIGDSWLKLFTASIASLFIFDYFYQLEDEVTFIWSRGDWSVGKALFVLTRYIPFIIIPLALCSAFATNLDVHICETLLYIITILQIVAITLSEVIFGLRAYAMWNRNKAVLAFPLTFAAQVYVAAVGFILQLFLPAVTFGESPTAMISGCYETGSSSVIFAVFVVIMFVEAVTTTLTLYRAFRYFQHAPNSLSENMTRGGVFYCVTMFSMSVANVLLIFLLPAHYTYIFTVYQTVMHTVLATRMQLHLRKVDQHTYLVDRFAEESLVPTSFMRSALLADI
ncbi:hypothetical protein PAXINDRAFT_14184 [Paxillus involutus ATCC 200175]|uniref:DUF6533 domain-containing protein n=1 Tax=Paxillus involutus ATCC 200175 TaxID=664439 RepID=A0A0C9SUU8_PAXIN|nr:hypothetical protein PAXINDRAFT_14184 [Paxillus involutus ATCC 200175]